MSTPPPRVSAEPNLGLVFDALDRAAAVAAKQNCSRWEFAVELEQLLAAGATTTDLRGLLMEGIIEAAVETTAPKTKRRSFRKVGSLAIPPRTCFVLANGKRNDVSQKRESHMSQPENGRVKSMLPRWDSHSQTLSVGKQIIKRLRRPASSQSLILNAFEEEGWVTCIDDPLHPRDGIEPKSRLHSTINCLNRGLVPLIHFHSNGNGRAVCWQWTSDRSSF